MTDKQIIIDGIDVSGCEYYDDLDCYSNRDCCGYPEECKDNPNCYYKQLKRKEKSEEKLIEQIQTICDFINNRPETFKGINGSVGKIITDYAERKEQECVELKLDLIEARAHGDYLNNLALSETLNLVSEQFDQLKVENDSLKKQLKFEFDETLLQYSNTLEELKAENEELKKWQENIIDLFNRTCRCKYLNEETEICSLNNKKCISINECMYRKQQTLTEIKEIAEERNYLDYNECLDDILQKISEVEDEHN